MRDDDFELDAAPTSATPALPLPSVKMDASVESEPLDVFASREILDHRESISSSQEATRAKIAWTFTQIFLLIVVFALVLPTIIKISFPEVLGDPIETTKTLLTLIASVLAGPFGFIVGFYFKQTQENG